jgi:hypothetical protein
MSDTTTNFDFNDAGEQRIFDVIPANTIVTVRLTIRPGGAGDDGWLKRAADGASEHLDCEFFVMDERFDGKKYKKKFYQPYTMRGTTDGHAEASRISRDMVKAMLESAHGFRPDDKSEAAQNARKISSWADLDQLRFVVRLGVRPPQGSYPAKNTILEVITPNRQEWERPEQISAKSANGGGSSAPPTSTPPAGSITRPAWGQGR